MNALTHVERDGGGNEGEFVGRAATDLETERPPRLAQQLSLGAETRAFHSIRSLPPSSL